MRKSSGPRWAIDPRKLRRVANILSDDADSLEESHTCAGPGGARVWGGGPIDALAKRDVQERRRLAADLRKAAG